MTPDEILFNFLLALLFFLLGVKFQKRIQSRSETKLISRLLEELDFHGVIKTEEKINLKSPLKIIEHLAREDLKRRGYTNKRINEILESYDKTWNSKEKR